MQPVLTSQQIRAADGHTIKKEGIPSHELMERASKAFVQALTASLPFVKPTKVMVFCGPGNNGGDGLCISRMLHEKKFNLAAFSIRKEEGQGSEDFHINYDRLKAIMPVGTIKASHDFPAIPDDALVIDAIFGSGLSRPLEGVFAELAEHINHSNAKVVAVDIASGLPSESPLQGSKCVKVQKTISFQVPKLAFFLPENDPFVGQWEVVDIGLDQGFIRTLEAGYYLVDEAAVRAMIPGRKRFDHKGVYGKGIFIGGSHGKIGAAVLGARAALRAGIGLLHVHVPACGYPILQTAVPEAMVSVDAHEKILTKAPNLEGLDAMAFGPGAGTEEPTKELLESLFRNSALPMVLDADGINFLGLIKDYKKLLAPGTIVTPHVGELDRMLGPSDNGYERLEKASDFAKETGCILVLKGAWTATCTPSGKIYFNPTGNPGMATAGSGDVLTGVILALLARGLKPEDAAMAGVFFHGLSGDDAAADRGMNGLIASDIIEYLRIEPRFGLATFDYDLDLQIG